MIYAIKLKFLLLGKLASVEIGRSMASSYSLSLNFKLSKYLSLYSGLAMVGPPFAKKFIGWNLATFGW